MTEINKKIIAIRDDNSSVRMSIEKTIKKYFQDINVLQFNNTIEIKKFLLNNPDKIDLLILDIYFGFGETGIDILPLKELSPNLPIILLSALGKKYGSEITNIAGEYIIDFISKPATDTELIIKIKKALSVKDDKTKTIENLQKENHLLILTELLNLDDKGAGQLFEDEVQSKLKSMTKVFMQHPYEPKENIIINGQEIDIIAFTASPLPFSIMLFEAKYFPNATITGSINDPTKVVTNNIEKVSTKRRNFFEQSENQFKQVSNRIQKILHDFKYTKKEEKFRPFIQNFIVFPDTTDISQIQTKNANKYTKICKLKDLTQDFLIKTAFSMPKRIVDENVKTIILQNLGTRKPVGSC